MRSPSAVVRLHHEGQIDILALDFGVAAHVLAQAGVFRERPRLGCAEHDEPIGLGLVADDPPDVSGLLVDGVARLGRRLDPVDEAGKPTVRPTLRGRGTGSSSQEPETSISAFQSRRGLPTPNSLGRPLYGAPRWGVEAKVYNIAGIC